MSPPTESPPTESPPTESPPTEPSPSQPTPARSSPAERILVTGATGFIGSHVARLLSEQGREPRLMFRRRHRAETLADLDAELVIANLEAPASIERAVADVDAVIHLAGRATFEPYRVVAPTLVDGTETVARLAAKAGAHTIVHMSSSFVYPSVDGPITAETPADPLLGYGHAKRDAEESLRRIAADTGIRTASLRVPHVYGAGSIMFDYVDRGFVPFAGEMDTVFSHLHVEDAARALVAAVDSPSVEGPVPLADGSPLEWERFFDEIRRYLPNLRVLDLPAGMAERLLRWVEPLRLHRSPSMATVDTVRGWRMRQAIRPEWQGLGIEPMYPSISTGIPATLETTLPAGWSRSLADRRR